MVDTGCPHVRGRNMVQKMTKPVIPAEPQFTLKSSHPKAVHLLSLLDQNYRLKRYSDTLTGALAQAKKKFATWKPGMPESEWVITCDETSATLLRNHASDLE